MSEVKVFPSLEVTLTIEPMVSPSGITGYAVVVKHGMLVLHQWGFQGDRTASLRSASIKFSEVATMLELLDALERRKKDLQ